MGWTPGLPAGGMRVRLTSCTALVHVGLGMFVHGMRLCAATGPGRRRVRMTDESHMSCRTAPWPGRVVVSSVWSVCGCACDVSCEL